MTCRFCEVYERGAARLNAALLDAWHGTLEGTEVIVLRDDGTETRTKTRSEPWALGDGTPVIKIEGINGGYALERVRKVIDHKRIEETNKALDEIDRKFNKLVAQRDAERLVARNRLDEAQGLLRRALAALELRAIGDPNHLAALSDLHQRLVKYAP